MVLTQGQIESFNRRAESGERPVLGPDWTPRHQTGDDGDPGTTVWYLMGMCISHDGAPLKDYTGQDGEYTLTVPDGTRHTFLYLAAAQR